MLPSEWLPLRDDDEVVRRSNDFPREWWVRLREISPVSDRFSYLEPIWFRRTMHGGTPRERVLSGKGRWVLYQIKPRCALSTGELLALAMPHPRTLPKHERPPFPDAMQWEWFHEHGSVPVPFWVLQGPPGGHPVEYQPWQAKVLRAMGLPTIAPPVGELPMVPFDEMTVAAIQSHNRLLHYGNNWDALARSGEKAAMEREQAEGERQFRVRYLEWLKQALAEPADVITWAHTKSETDMVMEKADPADIRAAMEAEDRFIETGSVLPV